MKSRLYSMATTIYLLSSMFLSPISGQDYTFTPLGDLAGGTFRSVATDVSADGSVVVGTGRVITGERAFRWTQSDGMVDLGTLNGPIQWSRGLGVSSDGSTVVGQSRSPTGDEAFRWRENEGMIGLGYLPIDGAATSEAAAASADGSYVTGWARRATPPYPSEAFRWSEPGGLIGLGDLPSGEFNSSASDISDDGAVVVGSSQIETDSGMSAVEAFRWANGMIGLGSLDKEFPNSGASAISAEGTFIVGQSRNQDGFDEAMVWAGQLGMEGLGDLPGGLFGSSALGVSADGSRIVGWGFDESGPAAFLFVRDLGMFNLKFMLQQSGIDMTGWKLSQANAISDDGQTIVGAGTNPQGWMEGWRVTVPDFCTSGDVNRDGVVNLLDVGPFAELVSTGGFQCEADTNQDGVVNLLDVEPFVVLLSGA